MAFTKVVGAGIHTLSNITSHNINSSGIITATKFVGPIEGDITAVDGVFTGNVSIGGTLTYEDVKNVDSVGVGTFREGIFIPDSKRIRFGNTNASPNFSIYSTPTYKQGVIDYTHTGTGRALRIRATNLQIENWNGLTPTAKFIGGVGAGHVELNYAGSKKFETTSSGVSIGGTTIITPASGGKLGIGTNIPLSGTHISDGAAYGSPQNASRKATLTISAGSEASADIQLLSANYNHIFFGDSADPNTGMIHYEHTGSNVDSLVFSTAGSERLRIYSDGDAKFSSKLGVGVEPVEYLDIRTTGSATALVGSTNASGAYFKLDGDSNGDGSGGDYARLVHDTDGRFYIDNLKSTADIVFRNGASATERLSIGSNGYVNIGTGSAEQQLTVQNSAQHCVIRVISKNTHDVGIDFGDVDNTDIAGVRYSNSENSLRLNANAATRLKIDSGGRTMIGGGSSPTQVGDGRLIVYSTDRLHPSIKPAGTSNNYANGYSMIGDNYTATESQVNLGVSYSSGGLVLSRSVKVSGTTDNTYLSSQAQYATRPCAIKLDSVGAFNFLTTETNANTAVDSAVTLSKRLRIASNGTSHFYGNQTSTPEGDFGFRWDKNSYANFQLTNTNNTTVNAGARVTLKTNVGNITGTYYNNGGFYLVNSANGYFNYYSNSVLRININTNGDFFLNPDNANGIPTSNGQVGKRFGIKSTQNNVIIGETTSSGNVGLMLESRVTGRSGGARSSQIELANGVMRFYTAASGADVTERLRITSTGVVQFKDNQGTYTNTVHSHSGEAGFITHYTARTTYGGADLYRRMLDIASGGANPHGSSIRFLTSDNNSNPATCIERMRIMDGGGVFIGTKTHTQRYSHAESPALLTVQNGARVTTSSSTYAAPKGGFCDYARYELEQKLISFSTSNVQLTQARNGQPLTINNSRDPWAHYSNLPNYLLGHAATDNINNTNFTLTLYANMTVFLLRTNGWNSVDLTNWNLIESDTQIGPASSDTRLYVKSLAAGTYTNFDNDSAMYFFVL